MASVRPGKYDPLKPDIELLDKNSKRRFGLKLEGAGALQIGTMSQDDSVHIRAAGKRIGDFDEQRSWKGGRGIEKLSDNPIGYWDSQNAWTLADGHVHQTLLWQFARGTRSCDFDMPSKTQSLTFAALTGSSLHLAVKFTASASYNADYCRAWIRRVGTPGTLTVKLASDSAGTPGTILKTATVTTSDITDTVSVLKKFDWSGTQALVASTAYHLIFQGDSADNKNNHWEVGGLTGGSNGNQSSDGSTWSNANFNAFYFIADADVEQKWFMFFLDEAAYIVSSPDSPSGTSKLYINGDRGKASSGSATALTDSSKTWVVNRWAGAFVKIIRGTGVGQVREIASNTSISLVPTVNWTAIPDSTSEYIIYATEWFTEITSTGLGRVLSQPAVVNQIVYFPQGAGTNTRQMVWRQSTASHFFQDDGTNKANYIIGASTSTGTLIWKALATASEIAFSTAPAWAETPGTGSYQTKKVVGDTTSFITGLNEKDGFLYIFKTNAIYRTSESLFLVKLDAGLEKVPAVENGAASIAHQQFMYYSWLHSLIRIYGSTHDDIGQDWSGWGLPDGREGVFASLDSYTSLLMAAVDAGSGTSSVLGFDGVGWHEILRGIEAGVRIRMVKVQPCEGTRNRTWVDMGGHLVYQEMPFKKGSPRLDPGCRYMHEAVIESAAIDMGTASALPKFIKELTVFCENLGGGNEIRVDYQVDDDVHTNNWTEATALFESPESTAYLGLSNIRRFAYRLRILSTDNTKPVDVQGIVPNGYARSPYKMVWTMRCRADNITSRGRLVKPDELMRWLLDNARFPGRIEMRSQYVLAHKFFVIIHPPRMFPYKPAQAGQAEESIFTLVLEEA